MRVLVTGAEGLLGSEVVRHLPGHEVSAVDLDDFDITSLDDTMTGIRDAAPDAIVHCAAWADVDGAENDFEGAFRVNGIGTKNMALAANETGARLLYISTDYVFDGTLGRPYIESDPVGPLGAYGRSKWMGEQMVRELADSWTVVRTQALYGRKGKSFVKAILARVEAGEPLKVVDDQTVSPTRAGDLAAALQRILDGGTAGVYHASSRGECTWFQFAKEILSVIGKPDHPISPISSETLGYAAPRPAYSVLRNFHLELTIGDTLPDWRQGLSTHLSEG